MRSLPVPVVSTALRLLLRPVLGPPVPIRAQRAWMHMLSSGAPVPVGVQVEAVRLAGLPAERLTPPGADASRTVLLLHGGAFITGSPRTHRAFASRLAVAAGCSVHVLDHRLAPEHPYPAGVDDAVAAYDALSASLSTSVVGDSTGGALALLLCRTRRSAALALVSPLADLTRRSSSAWPGRDVIVREGWAEQGTQAFLGGMHRPSRRCTTTCPGCRRCSSTSASTSACGRRARSSRAGPGRPASTSNCRSCPASGTTPTCRRTWSPRPTRRSPRWAAGWPVRRPDRAVRPSPVQRSSRFAESPSAGEVR